MGDTELKMTDILALDRTRMAADRTLMGWIRTALSLIGFGFTIYKFLEAIQSKEFGSQAMRPHSPQTVGLTLIGIGVFSLVIACIQHWKYVKKLRPDQPYRLWDLGLVVCGLIGLLGLAMIVSIIVRVGPLE